jgi:hypothetical protein
MARPRRFERPTPAFGGQYSIQLSYGRGVARNSNTFSKFKVLSTVLLPYNVPLSDVPQDIPS